MTDEEFQALKDEIKPLSQERLRALLYAAKQEEEKASTALYSDLLTEQELDLLVKLTTE